MLTFFTRSFLRVLFYIFHVFVVFYRVYVELYVTVARNSAIKACARFAASFTARVSNFTNAFSQHCRWRFYRRDFRDVVFYVDEFPNAKRVLEIKYFFFQFVLHRTRDVLEYAQTEI